MQSSCTRYDMEAQSTHRKQELPIASGASMDQNGQNIQMKNVFNHEIAAKGAYLPFLKYFPDAVFDTLGNLNLLILKD